MMDHMLIRVGMYLRIIGYDAEWIPGVRTHDLILKANAENRYFVTRNRKIREQFPAVSHLVILRETEPVLQFKTLVQDFHLDTKTRQFSRCIRCNVELSVITERHQVEPHVHPGVFLRQATFYTCPKCGTIFWHGSHVTNTCRKLDLPSGPPAH